MRPDPLFADWHPVARSCEIETGRITAVRLLGQEFVVWRSGDGAVHVWEDRCAHRGVRLSLGRIAEDRLICAYHGWEYASDGQCVRYPAHERQAPSPRATARTCKAVERYGLVWACLGEPRSPPPPFPEADDGGYHIYFGGRFDYQTSAQRAIENFLDVSHFPFVHDGYLGDGAHTEIKDYDVTVGDAGISVTNVRVWQPKPTNTLDVEGLEVGYEYYVPRPLTARLTKQAGVRNRDGTLAREAIVLTMTPVEPEVSVGWVLLASNYDQQYGEEEVQAFTSLIISQDVRVVESQRPKRLPLDLGQELHVRSDRTAVEYRRWLKSQGVRFGTVTELASS